VKEASPKLLKVLRLQFAAAIINSIAASISAVILMNYFLEDVNLFLALILSVAAAWCIARVLNVISIIAIQLYVYGTDTQSVITDTRQFTANSNGIDHQGELVAPNPGLKRININILDTPEKPIGTFMGKSFFEWLIIDDGINGPRKYVFSGTTPMRDDETPEMLLQQEAIVIKPGLIYQVEH